MLLTEIAQQACVSPATVSRALNQPHRVAPERLARIRAVLQEHNYTPRLAAKRRARAAALVTDRRIGVWFVGGRADDTSLNWFQDQLFEVQAQDLRYRVNLSILFSNTADEVPPSLEKEHPDGIILQGMEPSGAALARLHSLPRVWFMTRRSPTYAGDYVEPNNIENGQLAANYLQARGHASVAVVAADPDYSAILQRVQAFTARSRDLGLRACAVMGRSNPGVSYLQILPPQADHQALVRRLLDSPARPTGLYLPSDHFCGSFFRALREAGRTPGRDFEAVVGNYNPIVYHNLDHSPAVIDINLPTLVRRVIDHLSWRIENPDTPGRVGITVSPTLRAAEGVNGA